MKTGFSPFGTRPELPFRFNDAAASLHFRARADNLRSYCY